MLSPNFKKNLNKMNKSKRSQQYRLYTNPPKVSVSLQKKRGLINQQTLEMMSPSEKSGHQYLNKQTLNRKRTEKLLEHNEGIKEVEIMEAKLEEIWSLFEFEKNILLLDIASYLKLNPESDFQSKSHVLMEGLEFFFKEVLRPSDLLEVPANQMVSEILKSNYSGSSMKSQDMIDINDDLNPNKNLISKSIQVLLTAAQIKEIFSQKLMVEKICENKGLRIRQYDSMIHLCSMEKKLRKKGDQLKISNSNLKESEEQRTELRKLLYNVIEKTGMMTNGVNTLFRMMQSNNDMQKNLQQMGSRGSPQRMMFSENNLHTMDIDKIKKLYKENLPINENEQIKYKSVFSPLKVGRCNGTPNSERDMMTPKTATFAEISKI